MFPQILRPFQFAILVLVLATSVAVAQDDTDDGFVSVGEYPWEGWNGPLADGIYDLRFGTGGFEVTAAMRARGLEPASARPHTLRFEGEILDTPAEVLTEFTGSQPSASDAQLRVIQVRWGLRGLPQKGARLFREIEQELEARYGRPVLKRDDGLAALENGSGSLQRLYYGPEARTWLELSALGRQRYTLVVRMESPQLEERDED